MRSCPWRHICRLILDMQHGTVNFRGAREQGSLSLNGIDRAMQLRLLAVGSPDDEIVDLVAVRAIGIHTSIYLAGPKIRRARVRVGAVSASF